MIIVVSVTLKRDTIETGSTSRSSSRMDIDQRLQYLLYCTNYFIANKMKKERESNGDVVTNDKPPVTTEHNGNNNYYTTANINNNLIIYEILKVIHDLNITKSKPILCKSIQEIIKSISSDQHIGKDKIISQFKVISDDDYHTFYIQLCQYGTLDMIQLFHQMKQEETSTTSHVDTSNDHGLVAGPKRIVASASSALLLDNGVLFNYVLNRGDMDTIRYLKDIGLNTKYSVNNRGDDPIVPKTMEILEYIYQLDRHLHRVIVHPLFHDKYQLPPCLSSDMVRFIYDHIELEEKVLLYRDFLHRSIVLNDYKLFDHMLNGDQALLEHSPLLVQQQLETLVYSIIVHDRSRLMVRSIMSHKMPLQLQQLEESVWKLVGETGDIEIFDWIIRDNQLVSIIGQPDLNTRMHVCLREAYANGQVEFIQHLYSKLTPHLQDEDIKHHTYLLSSIANHHVSILVFLHQHYPLLFESLKQEILIESIKSNSIAMVEFTLGTSSKSDLMLDQLEPLHDQIMESLIRTKSHAMIKFLHTKGFGIQSQKLMALSPVKRNPSLFQLFNNLNNLNLNK
ncbi:hypothetical protein DFA_06210 [Cavenderia fasciculata]|uniref:Uncharacterized protein n=1 Tax=Cavenderia fasciculata TaxID=261658 RepID=F4PKE8_CACFS|nr:uncharacterized protein DFA_06210 [Cavenderia fasciculata]EGG24072.1 hypothetical protein DFA_06210 [Cavenderia fasciculata]|eukprot:XP_004361923.1 hypothetical protein DFA_06210 [Cavenderia fasciculata]